MTDSYTRKRRHMGAMLELCQITKKVMDILGRDVGLIVSDYISPSLIYNGDRYTCMRCGTVHKRRLSNFCWDCYKVCLHCGKVKCMDKADLLCWGCRDRYLDVSWIRTAIRDSYGIHWLWWAWHMPHFIRDFINEEKVNMGGAYLFSAPNNATRIALGWQSYWFNSYTAYINGTFK